MSLAEEERTSDPEFLAAFRLALTSGIGPAKIQALRAYFGSLAAALQAPADPLRQSLRHCQRLGEAAVNDPGCLATWAENRDRFLGRTPVPATPHQNGGE